MRCPIGDFPLGKEERKALQRVIDSGRLSEGREVRALEDEFAGYCGTRHCVAVSSGTAALMVGLRALAMSKQFHLWPGARVLIPALTFIATANAVELAGMRIFFGDIDPETMGLAPEEVDKQIVDLVLPVHLMGYSADVRAIRARCRDHKPRELILVEDAAEAHGTKVLGKQVGTFGVWGSFSFYIAHTVQAGELGCIITDSLEVAQIARQLKAHGRECRCRVCTRSAPEGCPNIKAGRPDPRFRAQYVGWNFKPMEFQAALGRVQLSHIEDNIHRRQYNRDYLTTQLLGLQEAGWIEPFVLQPNSVPMAFPLILKRKGYRDRVVAELERRGVEARPLFGSIPTQQPAYAGLAEEYKRRVPNADRFGANGFYVGCHQYLTQEQLEYMASQIRDTVREVVT